MQSEDAVPLQNRFLSIEGHLSEKAKQALQKGMPQPLTRNMRICFVSYAYADLPLPKEFDTLFRYHREETIIRRGDEIDLVFQPHHLATALFTRIRIVAVTQQFGQVGQEVPQGWKTVCVIEFPDGVPSIIDALPLVDAWFESREAIAVCRRDTFRAIQQTRVATE